MKHRQRKIEKIKVNMRMSWLETDCIKNGKEVRVENRNETFYGQEYEYNNPY